VSELGITLEYLFGIVDQPYLSTKAVMLRVYPTDNPKRPCDKFEITGQLIGIGDYLKPESEYRAYRVMDDTNAPLIPPQSTVIVDRDWPPNDLSGLWAVSQAGEIQIRELVINNIRKTTELRCYNPAHKAVLVQSGDIDIIGRVIWHCQRH
jgi:hypothetical protein